MCAASLLTPPKRPPTGLREIFLRGKANPLSSKRRPAVGRFGGVGRPAPNTEHAGTAPNTLGYLIGVGI